MSVIIIIVEDNDSEEDVEDDKLPGEEWMYDKDINSGLYK